MTKIVLRGHTDVRVLDAADLAKAGVEGFEGATFLVNEPQEVSADVAEAILGDSGLFGKFEELKAEETQPALFESATLYDSEAGKEAPAKSSKSSK